MNWKRRSPEKEMLDSTGNSFEEIRQNMAELNVINRLLGGHLISCEGFRAFARDREVITICEIGCGGGDNLAFIHTWAQKKGILVNCIGIDINSDCISFAREQFPQAVYLVGDYRNVVLDVQPDVIFSALFCHHFSDSELLDQVQWMKLNSRLGFFINDLHRHPLAYYAIKCLTAIFSSSRLVRNDAPVSVQRGFVRSEWENIFRVAGFGQVRILWKWAFRWLVIVVKKENGDS